MGNVMNAKKQNLKYFKCDHGYKNHIVGFLTDKLGDIVVYKYWRKGAQRWMIKSEWVYNFEMAFKVGLYKELKR